MIDGAKLIAECEQIAAAATPTERAMTVGIGTCEQGCCKRLFVYGFTNRVMVYDMPPVVAQVLALQLAPELANRRPMPTSAN